MHRVQRWRVFGRRLRWLAACGVFAAGGNRAHAHPQAAQGPVFEPGPCVTVLDKSTSLGLHIPYTLPFDETDFGVGDIPLTDGKTHQFFAFRAAIRPKNLVFEAQPFDAGQSPVAIPEWIAVDDVQRAAETGKNTPGVTFSESDVPAASVLENDARLSGMWSAITASTARVPITMEQAKMGVHWDILTVPPGLYTVAGYIFSPPYNGWVIRPGLIKIVEGGRDLPAAVVDPVNEFVFPYQGRRVHVCLDTPAASRLRGYAQTEDRGGEEWTQWLADREVASGRIELCFRNPRPDMTGSLRLRFDVEAPDGSVATFYSPDTLTTLQGEGRCVAGEVVCCDGSEAPAVMPQAGQGAGGAGAAAPPTAGGAAVAPTAGGAAAPASPAAADGCSTGEPGRPARRGVWIVVALSTGALLLRRRRP